MVGPIRAMALCEGSCIIPVYRVQFPHSSELRRGRMLLDRARSQLLIVDVQERLMPAMHAGEAMAERCGILMQAAHRLGIPVTVSEQYRKGLGPTIARLDNLKGDAPVLEKMHFSCADDEAI